MIPLFCQITVDGKESCFSMKCDVNPNYWDVETGKATGRTEEAIKTNALSSFWHNFVTTETGRST
ncbi:hypothetical protein EZS27_008340 [termite gut metagenome]|uniref:Arm DNA-binding domain-containing protein n=1 Tax=termite gut metagenome TaxID=433724 RepID=A0A5J4SFB9_9ZZZZ